MRFATHLLILMFFSLAEFSFSQSGNYKYWDNTPLQWEDFYATPPQEDSTQANFEYRIGIRWQKTAINDTTVIKTEVYAYLYKKDSWVKTEAKNAQFLAYHQVMFDMMEVCRRKIQHVYYTAEDPYTADSLFEYHTDVFEENRKTFTDLYYTTSNKDSLLNAYQGGNLSELENTKSGIYPHFHQSRFAYGVNASVGYISLNQSLANKFSNGPIFNAGIDLETSNIVLSLNGTLGWNKVSNSFSSIREWSKNQNVGIFAVESSLGYNLHVKNFVVRPYVGIMYFQISPTSNLNAKNGFTIGGGNFSSGLITDYKIKKTVKLIPGSIFYSRMYSEMHLRLKLAYLPMNYGTEFRSNTFLVTIGVSTLSKVIKVDE